MSDEEMKLALRQAYERNDHARRMGSCTVPYMGSMAVNRICFILGDFRMVPDLFRAIERADTPKLKKAIEFCEEHGYLNKSEAPIDTQYVKRHIDLYLSSMPQGEWGEFEWSINAAVAAHDQALTGEQSQET